MTLKRVFLGVVCALSILAACTVTCFAQQVTLQFSSFGRNDFVFTYNNHLTGDHKIVIPSSEMKTSIKSNSTVFYNQDIISELNYSSSWWTALDQFQLFASPSDSPNLILTGYKGAKVKFNVMFRIRPEQLTNYFVIDKVSFKYAHFAFYTSPKDWTVYDVNIAEATDFIVTPYTDSSYENGCCLLSVTFSFTVPEDNYSVYGFTCSLGSSSYSPLNIKYKTIEENPTVDFWSYSMSWQFGNILFDNDPSLLDYGSPAPAPDISDSEQAMSDIDKVATEQGEQVSSFMKNYFGSLTQNIADPKNPLTQALLFCSQILNEIFAVEWITDILLWSAVLGILGLICGYLLPNSTARSEEYSYDFPPEYYEIVEDPQLYPVGLREPQTLQLPGGTED